MDDMGRALIRLFCLSLYTPFAIALPLLWPNPNAIQIQSTHPLYDFSPTTQALYQEHAPKQYSIENLKTFLKQQALTLNPMVIDKVAMSLYCAEKYHVRHNQILTVIDYSLPANQKRMWVFDLAQQKTLFHTHVSHGIGSGELFSTALSNKNQSRASSLGVYRTQNAYYGREGLSLKLQGLDRHFNDKAYDRYIVIHGGWYMDKKFIEKYGRPGRSWGCPALPMPEHQAIIKTIENNAWLVVYYPNEHWFSNSKYLNCQRLPAQENQPVYAPIEHSRQDHRAPVFFVELESKKAPGETVVTVSAPAYQSLFQQPPPLNRMLRRPIQNVEYIALSENELVSLSQRATATPLPLTLIRPVAINQRGYWTTKMDIVDSGDIASIEVKEDLQSSAPPQLSLITTKGKIIRLMRNESFIRWLGL